MTYNLELKSTEPCDLYIAARKEKVVALVVESSSRYAVLLGKTDAADFTVLCDAHSFSRPGVSVLVVNDLALVDGTACYATTVSDEEEEVINNALSGS